MLDRGGFCRIKFGEKLHLVDLEDVETAKVASCNSLSSKSLHGHLDESYTRTWNFTNSTFTAQFSTHFIWLKVSGPTVPPLGAVFSDPAIGLNLNAYVLRIVDGC